MSTFTFDNHCQPLRGVDPVAVAGLDGVGGVGVEAGVTRVLANTHTAAPGPRLGAPVSVYTPAPGLGLLGQLGQGRGLIREVTV